MTSPRGPGALVSGQGDEHVNIKEFAEAYAARSGATVAWLKENGLEPAPCDCGEEGCEGWQMAHRELLERDAARFDHMLPRDRDTLAFLRAQDAPSGPVEPAEPS